ncbi:MAG TPA: isochorismate synthase [Bacillales bacterium]|nr:isochorismate synthase [Bacillales bacterium]
MAVVKQQELQELLIKGIDEARRGLGKVIVSRSIRVPSVDPLSFFASGQRDRFFWMDPEGETVIVGSGSAHRLQAGGKDRFEKIEQQRRLLLENSIIDAPESVYGVGPIYLGGFSFDPLNRKTSVWDRYADAEFVLPAFMLTITGGETWLTVNSVVRANTDAEQEKDRLQMEQDRLLQSDIHMTMETQADPSFTVTEVAPMEWKESVRTAAREISDGEIEKVVLSRELRLSAKTPFSAGRVLQRLREEQPNSYLFAIERGESCFVGASPERLVKRKGDDLLSTCLAGTTARGKRQSEDRKWGDQLLHDPKNLHEHKVVVDVIREAMEKVCSYVELPDEPVLYKMKNVQHLYTPVIGKAAEHTSLLSVVKQLHPTPALGGFPKKEALQKIRDIEPHDRGWYGSPVGWLDYKGDGEFAVAIRCGLLQGNQASLFAGNGIVGDSEPESEYLETQMKFRPMLSALGGGC